MSSTPSQGDLFLANEFQVVLGVWAGLWERVKARFYGVLADLDYVSIAGDLDWFELVGTRFGTHAETAYPGSQIRI